MADKSDHMADAVAWYVKLTSEDVSSADKQAWAIWVNQSKQNAIAWEEIKSTLSKFQSIPSDIGMSVLGRGTNKVDLNRRATLKHIALFAAIACPTGLLLKDNFLSSFYYDYSTKVGERTQVMLSDGTTLALNTNSAVTVNLTSTKRVIKLHQGEMMITTGHAIGLDSPLSIETADGNVVPMGTRFNVRKFSEFTRVSLYEGKLKVTPKHNDIQHYMKANEEVDMYTLDVVPNITDQKISDAWLTGYLEVNNLSLKLFIEELARYRPGLLVCHPDVHNIKISGAYSIDDIDASLNLLSQTFPIRVQRATRFLTMVLPAT
ncbi:MAG: FecR domain-containing protein [Methylophilus sp.]|nr:FecR domain-containing protein [Methylophilus sp.]